VDDPSKKKRHDRRCSFEKEEKEKEVTKTEGGEKIGVRETREKISGCLSQEGIPRNKINVILVLKEKDWEKHSLTLEEGRGWS